MTQQWIKKNYKPYLTKDEILEGYKETIEFNEKTFNKLIWKAIEII